MSAAMSPEGFLPQPSHRSSATTNGSAVEDSAATVVKKKRNLPGNPDPDAEVVALSPGTLMATNRYMCEVCHKGFQRDQNLQLHRRGHNLPWKLKQRSGAPPKRRVYICPEKGCPHHDPSRALGDLTGIKKHYCRKHGEKKWKCDKCSKKYAVQSDWKAHAKICGTREYRCDCGTIFSRRDSFITHRAFCDALAEENYKVQQQVLPSNGGTSLQTHSQDLLPTSIAADCSPPKPKTSGTKLSVSNQITPAHLRSPFPTSPGLVFSGGHQDLPLDPSLDLNGNDSSSFSALSGSKPTGYFAPVASALMSATALLQKAAEMGAMVSDNSISPVVLKGFAGYSTSARSCGSVHEASCDPSDVSSQIDGFLMGSVQSAFDHRSPQQSGVLQHGLLHSQLLLQSESRNGEHSMGGGFLGGMEKDFYGGERATADFLSLGPVGLVDVGELGQREATNASGFADGQQMGSYSHGCSPLEKPMWSF